MINSKSKQVFFYSVLPFLSLIDTFNHGNSSKHNNSEVSRITQTLKNKIINATEQIVFSTQDSSTTEDEKLRSRMQNSNDSQLDGVKKISLNRTKPETIQYSTTNSNGSKKIYEMNSTDSDNTARLAGRRVETFENPTDIKDPKFQQLLDQYRGMVHKYSAPPNRPKMNQQFGKFSPINNGHQPNIGRGSYDLNPVQKQFYRNNQSINSQYSSAPNFVTTPTIREQHQGISQPALIRGRRPKWGKKIGRNDQGAVDIAADPSLFAGRQTTVQKTRGPDPGLQAPDSGPPGVTRGTVPPGLPSQATVNRFTTRQPLIRTRKRTTPPRVSFEEDCDYIAYYCLKAYDTGKVCGRTMFNLYTTFTNYCLMDFVNCMERYEVWQIVHMGECFELQILSEYLHYPYLDDYFLDQYYVMEDN